MLNLKSLFAKILPILSQKTGITMIEELKSKDGKVAIGSGQIGTESGVTITELCNQVRYSNGAVGSVKINSSTAGGFTFSGWYNYFYVPHRSGGFNSQINSDNHNYGNLFLSGMTGATDPYLIRYAGGIAEVKRLSVSLTGTSQTITAQNNTTNYKNLGTYIHRWGRYITVSFEIQVVSAATWPNVYPITGLPATYDSKEVYGSLLGPSGGSSTGQSVVVAIQSNGKVKMSGGVNGQTYTGFVTYISAS